MKKNFQWRNNITKTEATKILANFVVGWALSDPEGVENFLLSYTSKTQKEFLDALEKLCPKEEKSRFEILKIMLNEGLNYGLAIDKYYGDDND